MIESAGIARRFGSHWVLRGVRLDVRAGEIVGLMGANGSGKTTLLRILCTLLKPSSGTARVCGHDVVEAADLVRHQVGFLGHQAGFYDDLTARENLRFAADMRGVSTAGVSPILERVGLEAVSDDRVRGFSAGMLRRLALGRLLLSRARVLLLDEPYSNLDADGTALMNAVMAEVRQAGGAALMVLHEVAPAERLLDRTLTMVDGRVGDPALSIAVA